MALQWTPHRWDPVVRPGEDLRLTFHLRGAAEKLEAAKVRIAAGEWPLTLSGEGAQLLIPAAEAAQLPDRAPAAGTDAASKSFVDARIQLVASEAAVGSESGVLYLVPEEA